MNITRGMDSTIVLPEAQLGNRALSTSGVMEQSFVQEGRIYSHLIDPTAHGVQTDRPVRQMLQATVLATNSTLADALSTAMFLLGHERGPAVLSQFVDCSALWVYDDGKNIVYQTHAWPGGNDSFN